MEINGLIRKLRLISKFVTSETELQIILIHISHNIPRSQVNQKMKFGQLIDYNTRKVFLEKSYPACGGEAIRRVF